MAYRAVKLGPVVDGLRVIREGLRAGDLVVVNGLQRVHPGVPVTPPPSVLTTGRSREESLTVRAEDRRSRSAPAAESPPAHPAQPGRHDEQCLPLTSEPHTAERLFGRLR